MTEPIKTRYTWLIEYATPSDAPAAHAHMQALGGEVVAVQFSDALGELSRAEAERDALRAALGAMVDTSRKHVTDMDDEEAAAFWAAWKVLDEVALKVPK
jgi:hypothetical protein